MEDINTLKTLYDLVIREALSKNKKILIDSFVEYYGERYRELIERRYSEITFIYYVDWKSIDKAYNDITFYDRKSILPFYSYLEGKNLKNTIIGLTDNHMLECREDINFVNFMIQRSNPAHCINTDLEKFYRNVFFQVPLLSESFIIHEINHALTTSVLASIEEEGKVTRIVTKSGLSIDTENRENTSMIEELLNDIASKEITAIFKRKGGDLTSFCKGYFKRSAYELNYFMIEEFYTKYKEYIKTARITDDQNELINRVGRELYDKFSSLIDKYYEANERTAVDQNRRQNILNLINPIIEKMQEQEMKLRLKQKKK